MKVSELSDVLGLEVITKGDNSRDVKGCYIGDLLSWVMGKASEGDAWITIMSNINIVAVATLTEAACIILCEGVNVEEDVIQKAEAEGVAILKSPKTAYETALLISGVI